LLRASAAVTIAPEFRYPLGVRKLRQIGAYIERDIRITLSYPLVAGFMLVGATAALLIFFFLGKLTGNLEEY